MLKKKSVEKKKDINLNVVEKRTLGDNSGELVKVGLSIKVTRNLGNYESMSANAWEEKYVKAGEEEEAYQELSDTLYSVLEEYVKIPS